MADAFLRALAVVLFVFTTWLFGAVARRLSAPALVGEVVAGMVLGPKGLDAVPHDEAFALIGAVGLALLVLEGGLHVELATLRRVGKVAFAVALSGTVLPLATAWAALALLPAFRSREGLLCGTALSSTAIGMAAQLMGDLGVLDAELGQVVVTAAMFDDVLSLCLLAMVSKGLGDGVFALFVPLLSSAAFIVATAALAYKTPEWLGALRQGLDRLPRRRRRRARLRVRQRPHGRRHAPHRAVRPPVHGRPPRGLRAGRPAAVAGHAPYLNPRGPPWPEMMR